MTAWLLAYVAHATVLYVFARFMARRLADERTQETLWKIAVFAPVLTASLSIRFPFNPWPPGVTAFLPGPEALAWADSGVVERAATVVFTIGALLLVRDVAAHALFLRRLGTRIPAGPAVSAELEILRARADVGAEVRATCALGLTSPVTLGAREICLPFRAERDLTSAGLRALLCHELAHVVRHDAWWFRAIGAVESLCFFQPTNRIMRRELQRLAERACDRWAAERLGDARAVAECLVEVAGWTSVPVPLGYLPVTGGGDLAARIEHLLEPRTLTASRRRSSLFCVPSLLVLAALLPPVNRPVQFSPVQTHADRSPEFVAGFEAARRYRASHPGLTGAAGARAAPDDVDRRIAIERRLSAAR